MCSTTPLVIIPSGEPICSQYNITLRNVQEYLDGGLLKTLHEESFMIYRQIKCDGTCQIGIFAAIEVDDCAKRVVRPHEKVTCKTDITVHNKPVQLRVRPFLTHILPSSHLMLTYPLLFQQSYMDPVMLLYRESSDINSVVDRIVSREVPFESIDGDGDTPGAHHIWTVKDPAVSFAARDVLCQLVSSVLILVTLVFFLCRIFWRFSVPSKALSIFTLPMAITAPLPLASKLIPFHYSVLSFFVYQNGIDTHPQLTERVRDCPAATP